MNKWAKSYVRFGDILVEGFVKNYLQAGEAVIRGIRLLDIWFTKTARKLF